MPSMVYIYSFEQDLVSNLDGFGTWALSPARLLLGSNKAMVAIAGRNS